MSWFWFGCLEGSLPQVFMEFQKGEQELENKLGGRQGEMDTHSMTSCRYQEGALRSAGEDARPKVKVE